MTRLRSLIKEVLSQEPPYYIIQSLKTGSPKYIASIKGEKPSWVPDSRIKQAHKFATLEDAKNYLSKFDTKRTAFWHIYRRPYDLSPKDVGFGRDLKESKKNCNCGCGGCGKKAPVLTESKTKTTISEGLQYHIDKKVPLHESVYRIGSEKHFALINEARALWVRELINVSEDDQAILETHLGNFGLYEGEKVPLDLPMVVESYYTAIADLGGKKTKENLDSFEEVQDFMDRMIKRNVISVEVTKFSQEGKSQTLKYDWDGEKFVLKESLNEDIYDKFLDDPQNPKGRAKAIISKFIKQYGEDASGMAVDRFAKQNNLKPEEKYILQYITKNDISISSKPGGPDFSALGEGQDRWVVYDTKTKKRLPNAGKIYKNLRAAQAFADKQENAKVASDTFYFDKIQKKESLEEKKKTKSKKKDPPLNKPKRGGSKAYYVYVRDPKTKKIKKVSFGSGGLRAKIKNPKARKAFAARHNCKNKKDRTKAGYWSCNLPRYAEQLGLGSKMNTFW